MFTALSLCVISMIFLCLGYFRQNPNNEKMPVSSGFPEYDLIPAVLKQKMDSLKAAQFNAVQLKVAQQNIDYSYWYYFDTEDVNKHYYIDDAGIKIIEEMEKEIYPEGMVIGRSKIQEVIDAAQQFGEYGIPGSATSFVVRQGTEPAGYMLWKPEISKIDPDEQVPYIQDFGVVPKFQNSRVARKMMDRMFENARVYDVPAIEMHCRESTSYRLLTNPRVKKWMESKGYKLAYNEQVPSYDLGGENFYFIRLEKITE